MRRGVKFFPALWAVDDNVVVWQDTEQGRTNRILLTIIVIHMDNESSYTYYTQIEADDGVLIVSEMNIISARRQANDPLTNEERTELSSMHCVTVPVDPANDTTLKFSDRLEANELTIAEAE